MDPRQSAGAGLHRTGEVTRLLLLLLAGAPTVATAQVAIASTTLRFGMAYLQGTPTGSFGDVVRGADGFATWFALPLSRTSPLGIRAEFSILTIPEDQATVPFADDTELAFTLRSTVGFTGVGPRLETRVGPLIVAGAVMGGLTRVIADVNGVLEVGPQVISVELSESEQALSAKAVLDAYFPILHGARGAALGLVAGLDYQRSTAVNVIRSGSLEFVPPGEVRVDVATTPVSLWGWRVGVGVYF